MIMFDIGTVIAVNFLIIHLYRQTLEKSQAREAFVQNEHKMNTRGNATYPIPVLVVALPNLGWLSPLGSF